MLDLVAKKLFLTKGKGVHEDRLTSFEFALRDAGIAGTNLVLISLKIQNLGLAGLSGAVGISEKELEIFLDELIKEGKIEKKGDEDCLK